MSDRLTLTFYLLRHAESAPDRRLPESDWPLSPQGEAQSQALVLVLERLGITCIVSSPYLRALRTVEPFARQAGLDVAIDTDLRERNLAEGYATDWETLIRRAWDDLSFRAPGGESGLECQQRVAACIERWIRRANRGSATADTILFSSHGNAIGLYLNLLDPSFGFDGWRAMHNPDLFQLVYQEGQVTWVREFISPGF